MASTIRKLRTNTQKKAAARALLGSRVANASNAATSPPAVTTAPTITEAPAVVSAAPQHFEMLPLEESSTGLPAFTIKLTEDVMDSLLNAGTVPTRCSTLLLPVVTLLLLRVSRDVM